MSTELATLRQRIAALQAEHLELTTAGPGREALAGQADALVDQLAEDGRRRLLAGLQTTPMNPFRLAGLGTAVDARPLLVGLLGPAAVKKALRAILEEVPPGLTSLERSGRLVSVQNELLALERQEEALVRTLEDRGQPVQASGPSS
jgi:hypothetical protein